MTPEHLERIRERSNWYRDTTHSKPEWSEPQGSSLWDRIHLLEYIDLLHEDLRLTRTERDQEKRKCLELRKENAALRRGQGRAPVEQGPGDGAYHRTNPIPDSTKADQ